ncbi:TPA: hypothetical protein ACE8R8_002133, partial [Neisseria gonorrhoeae]
ASTKSHTANVAAPPNDSAVMMLNRVSIVLFPFGRFYGSGSDSRRFRHSRRFPSFPPISVIPAKAGIRKPRTRQESIGNG